MIGEIVHTEEVDRFLSVAGNQNVFITGRAGTGKTTVTRYFREHFRGNIAVVAPTGIAALQAGGETVHSFFGIKPGQHLSDDWVPRVRSDRASLIASLDAVIVDEVSMVRSDLMGFIDQALRYFKRTSMPFGGVSMVLVGDPYQLPPVVGKQEKVLIDEYASPFFFDAPSFDQGGFHVLELTHPFRQVDDRFLDLLDAVRTGEVSQYVIDGLNRRAWSGTPGDEHLVNEAVNGYVVLCPLRAQVDRINGMGMSLLSAEPRRFIGTMQGDFPQRDCPVDLDLELKEGARVMIVANNHDLGYVNGQTGVVTAFSSMDSGQAEVREESPVWASVELDDGRSVRVVPYTWDRKHYEVEYVDGKRKVSTATVGRFTQLPVKPAWASTIHKVQGMTIDRGIVDLRTPMFEGGQLYVALSRLTHIGGLQLTRPVTSESVKTHDRVREFMRSKVQA